MNKNNQNLLLRREIIRTVENQLNQDNPHETRLTLNRLMENNPDCDYDEAVRKMAVILAGEMHEMMKGQEKFNVERYIRKLKELK